MLPRSQMQRKWKLIVLLSTVAVFAFVISPGIAEAGTIYVDPEAKGANTGANWADAYTSLAEVLACRVKGAGDEVWVAEGTYKPGVCCSGPCQVVPRTPTFTLINGVAVYGGFPSGGCAWEDRNPNGYRTILSGDIGTHGDSSDNSYHVVTGSDTDETTILDGFIITGGNANGDGAWSRGGGMYCWSGSPVVSNCIFTGNSGIQGGGIYVNGGAPILRNNLVYGNSAKNGGGGGMYLEDSCAIHMNNTVVSNMGGGVFDRAFGLDCSDGYRIVTNCILCLNDGYDLWADDQELLMTSSAFSLFYGNVQVAATSIALADPLFVNASAGDYHLTACSPCIDTGSNNTHWSLSPIDLDGNPRVVDGDGRGDAVVDMGAFEATVGLTLPGGGVLVQPTDAVTGDTPVTIVFDDVTVGGVTTVTSTTPSDQQGAPQGFRFGNPPTMYEISTTASYSGDITVCFDYSGANYGNEANLRLFHRTESGGWEDITTSVDTVSQIICGTVTSFSLFGAFESEHVDPVVLLGELAGKVFGLNLQHGISNSLDAKLDAAMKALEDVNAKNDAAAVNTLEAFINAVEAQRGSKIPEADADDLIAIAQRIIAALLST